MRNFATLGLLGLTLMSHGCDDLSGFRGDYQGKIVSGDFVRSCFQDGTTATLHFAPDLAVAPRPGAARSEHNRLTTDDGTFDDTLLVPLEPLRHDPLGDLDFPGPARLRSYLLFARPDSGPLAGRDATVVVSLMEKGRIEVRVMAPTTGTCGETTADDAGSQDAGVGDAGSPEQTEGHAPAYFGLFRLKSA